MSKSPPLARATPSRTGSLLHSAADSSDSAGSERGAVGGGGLPGIRAGEPASPRSLPSLSPGPSILHSFILRRHPSWSVARSAPVSTHLAISYPRTSKLQTFAQLLQQFHLPFPDIRILLPHSLPGQFDFAPLHHQPLQPGRLQLSLNTLAHPPVFTHINGHSTAQIFLSFVL